MGWGGVWWGRGGLGRDRVGVGVGWGSGWSRVGRVRLVYGGRFVGVGFAGVGFCRCRVLQGSGFAGGRFVAHH